MISWIRFHMVRPPSWRILRVGGEENQGREDEQEREFAPQDIEAHAFQEHAFQDGDDSSAPATM